MTPKTEDGGRLAIRRTDGTVASKEAQERLDAAIALTFSSKEGKATLAWLEQIALRTVFEARDRDTGRQVSDAELWQQEGMRKVVALINERVNTHQRKSGRA